ncbi:MAG: DUF1573 domain-containing protein [Cyclobacteriaceae bacterium]
MKKSFSVIFLGIAVAVMAHMTSITWKSTSMDLGSVKQNEMKELSFEFTNSGDEPVRILEAKGSCGCTVVDFPKEEIAPGETASISANFKSAKIGQFNKKVTVKTTASDEPTYLNFTGEIVE